MNTIITSLVALSLILQISSCGLSALSNRTSELNRRFDIIKSDYSEVESGDSHGGFNGDGASYLVLDCSENKEKALDIVSEWTPMPLSENLNLMMYGGVKNGRTYGFNKSAEAHMPKIKNGYYKFYDRHSGAKDRESDKELFDRGSYNFSIAVYDTDTDRLYYFRLDT